MVDIDVKYRQLDVEVEISSTDINVELVGSGPPGKDGVGVPEAGLAGQVLKKVSDADYDTEWADESGAVLSVNGQTGEVVLDAEDVGAAAAESGVPASGSTGQVLAKASNTDYDFEWVDQSTGVDNVFWATYGTTTYAEIAEAYQAGKIVACKYIAPDTGGDEITYYLTFSIPGWHKFSAFVPDSAWSIVCFAEDSHWVHSSIEYAKRSSPILTGTPRAPTAATGTNTTQIATTAFVQQELNRAMPAPEVFWATYGTTTFDEISAARRAGKIVAVEYTPSDMPSGGLTYYLTDTSRLCHVFTTFLPDRVWTVTCIAENDMWRNGYVEYARELSPTFTGTPRAPTAATGTSTTQIATTEFVQQELSAFTPLPEGGYQGDILSKGSGGAEWITPASAVEQDNTRPITSAAVYTEVGNINALLSII